VNYYNVHITVADEPENNMSMTVEKETLIEEFPWCKDLVNADPDTFQASIVVGLTEIKIEQNYGI
jgi:hypothetical protein